MAKKKNDFEQFPAGKSVANLLPSFLKGVQIRKGAGVAAVEMCWKGVIGRSDLTRVEEFQNGVVVIKVQSAALHQQLAMEGKMLLARMQQTNPSLGIKKLVFRR